VALDTKGDLREYRAELADHPDIIPMMKAYNSAASDLC